MKIESCTYVLDGNYDKDRFSDFSARSFRTWSMYEDIANLT